MKTLKEKQEVTPQVGILIARFQVHTLHEAHRALINTVLEKHDRVLIFLGLSDVRNTHNNPLDFNSRKQMLLSEFPDANLEIHYINDCKEDSEWSVELDRQIGKWLNPGQKALLYGSRDSFIKSYNGRYPTCELESDTIISGTEMRRRISAKTIASADFRAGMIYASQSRYPVCYPTVDVAIFNDDYTKILLGKKPKEKEYRLIGGFADPGSPSYEADARREAMEETNLDVSTPEYVGSALIRDYRYELEKDKIKTMLFVCKVVSGRAEASDDISEIRWFDLKFLFENYKDIVVKEHLILIEMLKTYMDKTSFAR